MSDKIAVIRIRGPVKVITGVADTLSMLRLQQKHVLVILPKTDSMLGMIKKAKDYITWGEINTETLKLVEEKRGEKDPKDPKKLKRFFRLNSPRKGFERKGIKVPFHLGGALGYRGEKINDLIRRMI